MPAADLCGPRNKAMNVALQAPPQAGTLFTMYPSSLDRRPLSSTTARNRYDAAAALACAQRRDDVTRCNCIDMFLHDLGCELAMYLGEGAFSSPLKSKGNTRCAVDILNLI